MLLNIFWSRTDKIMGAYVTKMVLISSLLSVYIVCLILYYVMLGLYYKPNKKIPCF